MATQVQWRGGSTAEHATFTGAAREVTVDTQKKTLVVHDGSTAGGEPLLREDQANLPSSVTNGLYTPGTNQVALSTGGTGRLFVDASGNVGVGQALPAAYFDIFKSGAAQVDLRVRNGTGGLNFAVKADGTADISNVLNYPITFTTGAIPSEKLRITLSGQLLVGTSSAVVGSAALVQSAATINLAGVAVYADNTAATAGGLAVGDVYRTATGQLMIRY